MIHPKRSNVEAVVAQGGLISIEGRGAEEGL